MQLLGLTLGFLLFLGLSRLLLGRYPRRRWRTDIAYWFLGPLGKGMVAVGVVLAVSPFVLRLGLPLDQALLEGRGPLSRLPLPLQGLLALFVTDFVSYWMHRIHHGPLWRSHAIHHSSTHLDWLASVRGHPLNVVMQRAPIVVVLLALGFDLTAMTGGAGAFALYGLLLHARVDWDLGPLRRVFVSPRFHRWHHSRDHDCNYAGFLPLWDILFGTFYLPDHGPEAFGVRGDPVPPTLVGQLAYPFAARRQPRKA